MADASEMAADASDEVRASTLNVLCGLGWQHLDRSQWMALRGGLDDALLRSVLLDVLRRHRFDYRGRLHALSPSAIEQVVRELTSFGVADALLPVHERLRDRLVDGVAVFEVMPDGHSHRTVVPVIDWSNPEGNRWDVAERVEALSIERTHRRVVDFVCYVNGVPVVLIETGAPGRDAMARQLRNQRHDEVPQLLALAQMLMVVAEGRGVFVGGVGVPASAWARCDGTAGPHPALATLLEPHRLLDRMRGHGRVRVPETVQEPDPPYTVRSRPTGETVASWDPDEAKAETERLRASLRTRLTHGFDGDPYARSVFEQALERAHAVAFSDGDRWRERYALLRELEDQMDAGRIDGIPEALSHRPRARACYGVLVLALGKEAMRANSAAHWLRESRAIERAIDEATQAYSLVPHAIEAAIRRRLLPRFFKLMGPGPTKQALDHVIEVARSARHGTVA